jgi:hypothetical protein
MSTAIFEAKASGMALKNDALREAFAIDSVVCKLLKRGEHTSVFTTVATLTSGYRVKFDDNRSESGLFRYASTSLSFRDDWAEATHIAYGVGSSLEVFAFLEEEKDSIDPDGSSVYWSARMVKLPNERFTVV